MSTMEEWELWLLGLGEGRKEISCLSILKLEQCNPYPLQCTYEQVTSVGGGGWDCEIQNREWFVDQEQDPTVILNKKPHLSAFLLNGEGDENQKW